MKRAARVIDTKDEKKLGRVKVEIIPELQGFPKSLMPWANPEQMFDPNTDFEKHVPSEGSYIIVDVDSTWTVFSYDGSRPFSDSTTGSEAAYSLLSNVGIYSGSDPEPLDMEFSKDPDFLKFRDSTNGAMGLVFSNGRYLCWSGKDNKTLVYGYGSKKYFEFKEDGSFKYENPDKKTTVEADVSGNVKINCRNSTKIEMDNTEVKINGDNLVVKK